MLTTKEDIMSWPITEPPRPPRRYSSDANTVSRKEKCTSLIKPKDPKQCLMSHDFHEQMSEVKSILEYIDILEHGNCINKA